MCMNGLRINMGFGPSFGFWPSSFSVLALDHGPRHFMLQNRQKNMQKMKFLQNICANVKMTNNQAGVRTISDFDIKFMPLSRIIKG